MNKHGFATLLDFNQITDWPTLDHLASFACFRNSARQMATRLPDTGSLGPEASHLGTIAKLALDDEKHVTTNAEARRFFETHFRPWRVGTEDYSGFVTAYYEPEVSASRVRTKEYRFPLYSPPKGLVHLDDVSAASTKLDASSHLSPDLTHAIQTSDGFVEAPDRPSVMSGALDGLGLELFWLKSPVEAYYIHIQGSARLILTDGNAVRVGYAGKSGHRYTSIGKLMVERGILTLEQATMIPMKAWLEGHPEEARKLMAENRSHIFFQEMPVDAVNDRGPVAAAGVALTPGYSLAVDRKLHTYGTPVVVSTREPLPDQQTRFNRLMIAQDTGSAIVGAERGDLFIGSGDEAGSLAGQVKHQADFIFLLPAPATLSSDKHYDQVNNADKGQ